MIFSHIFNYQHVYTFNMLKSLLINYILHLLKYIKTHGVQCFAIIFEWFTEFFHISWIINIFTWVESFTLNLLKPLFKLLHTSGYPRPSVTVRRPYIVLLNSPYFLFFKMLYAPKKKTPGINQCGEKGDGRGYYIVVGSVYLKNSEPSVPGIISRIKYGYGRTYLPTQRTRLKRAK